jgi:hypothetical protein
MADYILKSLDFNQSDFRTKFFTRNSHRHCQNLSCNLELVDSHADPSPRLHQTAATYYLEYIVAKDRRKQDLSTAGHAEACWT